MQNKFKKLKEYLKKQGKQGICLAFSGGIDSMVLLYLCKEADTRVVAVTFRSEFQSDAEIELTKKLCEKYNVRQIIAEYDILSNPVIVNNPKDRCYHCKKVIFSKMLKIADEYNLRYVLDMKCSGKRKKGNVNKGIRRKRETGKHSKKVCCNRVAKPV